MFRRSMKFTCPLDVMSRELCRSIVTLPSNMDRSPTRHEIVHHWNEYERIGPELLHKCLEWNHGHTLCPDRTTILHRHIANSPEHRWVRRSLAWNPSMPIHTHKIIKSNHSVGTKISGDGWKRPISINNALHSF